MKQRISTAPEVRPDWRVTGCERGVDPTWDARDLPVDASHSRHAYSSVAPDPWADEITARARAALSVVSNAGLDHGALPASANDGPPVRVEPVITLLDVLKAAVQIEPDPVEAGLWCRRTRIAEFGDITAAELVSLGRADEVISFLHAVRDGARD